MSFIQMDPANSVRALKILLAAACTIPLAFVSWSLSRVLSSLMVSLGQNPKVASEGFTVILLSAVFMEAIVLFILLVALIILFVS
jgi:F0F1-type ATP synthase membrane subunit c/vacuolar-type H+-ATPase subunit K